MNTGADRRKRNKRIKIIRNICIALVPIILIGLLGFRVATDAKSMLADANQLKDELKQVMTCVKTKDTDGAESATLKMENTARKIDRTLSGSVWKAAAHMPGAGKYVKSVKTLVETVEDSSEGIIRPAITVMKDYPLSDLKVGDGFNVNIINAYLDLLENIEPQIDKMTTQMKSVVLPFGKTEMISEYTDKLSEMMAVYKENGEYLPLARSFLGDGSNKTYLLVAQNSSEIRAAGGFPGSIGTIKIQDGILSIGDFQTVYNVLSERVPAEANVTTQEKTIFSDWMRLSRDVCYDPDFTRVGQIWALAYESRNNQHVDGVVSLTPVIIQKVLAYTGGVTLSDGTQLNGDNATQVLQKDLYYKYLSENPSVKVSSAADYVDSLFAETAKLVMGKLVDDFDVNRISEYSKIFTDGGKDRTILMWMEDETAQSYVEAAGCSGALNTDENNPVAGVYFSCSYASKMGWFLNLDTEVGVPVINADGSRTYDMTVTMSNAITSQDIYKAGTYILGDYHGGLNGYIHLFAPAGGSISDFNTSNSMKMIETEYEGLQLGYNLEFVIYADNPITITYKVTTAPGVSTPLEVSTTPTLQNYR